MPGWFSVKQETKTRRLDDWGRRYWNCVGADTSASGYDNAGSIRDANADSPTENDESDVAEKTDACITKQHIFFCDTEGV